MWSAIQCTVLLGLCLLIGAVPTSATEEGSTTIEGMISDVDGQPVAECRVVVRQTGSSRVFISQPSDVDGRYSLPVPRGGHYAIVALISPFGGRTSLPETEPLTADGERVLRDLRLPISVPSRPEATTSSIGGRDRLFLSFVEDPAIVDRLHLDVQLDAAPDSAGADLYSDRVVAAFTFEQLPRVEIGARAGYGSIRSGPAGDESGVLDLDLWAKLHLLRSDGGRWNVAIGSLMRMPVGDADAGLGRDAIQSEWFASASRGFKSAVLIGHAGVVFGENGEAAGVPLDGRVTGSAGLGALVPLTKEASFVVEATYDGARFDHAGADTSLLVGANWGITVRGTLRAALAAGLNDASADARLIVGYATNF
jgi:hypothetical protein